MNIATGKYMGYGIVHFGERFAKWEESKGSSYHKYRAEWARRPLETDPGASPLSLNIEVTTRCNLACTFCTNPSLTLNQIGDLDYELYVSLLNELVEIGELQGVNLNGLGEPLLRKDLLDFVKAAKDYGLSDIMFHTNGTTLTEDLSVNLVNSGVDKIIVSVDSPNQLNYEKMRLLKVSYEKYRDTDRSLIKGFSHDRLINNTKFLIKTARESGAVAPIVRTTCVLTELTEQEMPEFVEMWKVAGADQITFQDLMWRDKLLENGRWENEEKNILEKHFEAIKERAINEKVKFICPQLYQATWVNFNGDIVPCSNPDARVHMVMGNLSEKPMKEIWMGMPYRSLRKLHEDGKWHEHPICGKCEEPLVRLYKHFTNEHTVNSVEVFED